MTAEIVIMNQEAVALAADSAVSARHAEGHKVFTSANKVFALSKYHPVGVMVYGNAQFMDVPWETIVKSFRSNLGETKFNSLVEYQAKFLDFLSKNQHLTLESKQTRYVRQVVKHLFSDIKESIVDEAQRRMSVGEDVTPTVARKIAKEQVARFNKIINNAPLITGLTDESVANTYGAIIAELREYVFEKFPLTKDTIRQLDASAVNYVSRWFDAYQPHSSGMVIAGFGEQDIYPSCRHIMLDGIANNALRHKEMPITSISPDNSASVVPFAQHEMVYAFMEGVDPEYQNAIASDIEKILLEYPQAILNIVPNLDAKDRKNIERRITKLAQQTLTSALKQFNNYRMRKFWQPIISVVSMLPKDELAIMAETLVELTSFRRKLSMDAQTVAGPIDVAVISKGDGLLWIKRKHYFKPELNHQFFANYYREEA